jgi:glycosyltransferase involved in cell wall biosynthesis
LEHIASELGVLPALKFLGTRPDSRRVIAGLDLFLLSSRIEGFPNVLLEAVMLGIPAIASDAGGASDVLDGPEALFGVGDVEGAAALVRTGLDAPQRARERAASLRARALSEFTSDRMAARWCALYEPEPGASLS